MPYTTREMLQAITLRTPLRSFFSGFFPTSNTHVAEILEFDVKKGRRVMAPFVAPRKGGKVLKREGFQTKMLRTPKIAPERVMTLDDITQRGFGENVYSGRTAEERADDLLATDMTELEESIQRRKEWMARQILLEGKIDVKDPDEGVDIQADFNFSNKEVLSGQGLWTDGVNSNPIANLAKWRRSVIKATGKAPTICLMAADVYDAFKSHPRVQKELENRGIKTAEITPRVIDPALTFLGRIMELSLDLYCYDEWFIDDEGTEQAMIPEGTVMLLPEEVGSWEYGGVTQMEKGQYITYEAEMVPKQYDDEKNEVKMLRMTSRPLPKPFDVNGWYVATVK